MVSRRKSTAGEGTTVSPSYQRSRQYECISLCVYKCICMYANACMYSDGVYSKLVYTLISSWVHVVGKGT